MKKVYMFTNIAPHYRRSLWEILLSSNFNIEIFYGFNRAGIKSIDFDNEEMSKFKDKVHLIKNVWFRGKVLIWQKSVIKKIIVEDFDVAIFLGEMYCLSTWISVFLCKIIGKKVIFWGHGMYGNENILKYKIRVLFHKLPDKLLVYGDRAKELLIKSGVKQEKIFVVYNSLEYDKHLDLRQELSRSTNRNEVFDFFSTPSNKTLMFIGRLTEEKKIEYLINTVNDINASTKQVNLLIIGMGEKIDFLKKIAKKGLKEKYIHFFGACYDEDIIGEFIYNSDLCISPGNIGLTAVHSLSLGTPVCSHSNMSEQGPEAEIIIDGYNGFFFIENDLQDLIEKTKKWLSSNECRDKIRDNCYSKIDKYYNPYYQQRIIQKVLADD